MKRTNTATWYESKRRWQIKVQKNGIRKTFYSGVSGRAGQRECNAKADAWLDDGVENPNAKISRLTAEYLENLKLTASTSHYTQYEKYLRLYIDPKIGNVSISDLHEQHLQSVIDYGYSKKLAKKALQNIRGCITAFMKYCRKCKYTTLFPEDLTIPRGAVSKPKSILQPDDLRKLFNIDSTECRGKPVHELFINAYRFEVSTGLRPGEVIGLKWSDIANSTVFLKRSINVYGEETTGKNENAQRIFTLTEISHAVLGAQREYQKQNGIETQWVFSDEYGECAKENRYYKRWVHYCEVNGIQKTTAYEMRHTFVSVVKSLLEGYLKQLVRHSKDMDTYGVYSHEFLGDSKKTAELVEDIFGKTPDRIKNRAFRSERPVICCLSGLQCGLSE